MKRAFAFFYDLIAFWLVSLALIVAANHFLAADYLEVPNIGQKVECAQAPSNYISHEIDRIIPPKSGYYRIRIFCHFKSSFTSRRGSFLRFIDLYRSGFVKYTESITIPVTDDGQWIDYSLHLDISFFLSVFLIVLISSTRLGSPGKRLFGIEVATGHTKSYPTARRFAREAIKFFPVVLSDIFNIALSTYQYFSRGDMILYLERAKFSKKIVSLELYVILVVTMIYLINIILLIRWRGFFLHDWPCRTFVQKRQRDLTAP